MGARASFRQMLGAAVHELPNALWSLRPARRGTRGAPWIHVHNRRERLEPGPGVPGVRCDWRWTSSLHIARVFPRVGVWLLKRALRDWPVGFAAGPLAAGGQPDVSFIIGHRGRARQPHIEATLATVAAQAGVAFECVVVEQSPQPELEAALPGWVRYVHTRCPAELPYNRSWALNVGAERARGRLLVLHDNDMLVPRGYAAQLWRHFSAGYEVLNLKRLIFYVGAPTSARAAADRVLCVDEPPEDVVQNAEAGGSVAVGADVFRALGGLDERFVGWGGEDNEFWERAQTRRVYPWGYLPFVHLHHPPQPEKAQRGSAPALQRLAHVSTLPLAERIAILRGRPRGLLEGPYDDAL